MNLGEGGPLRGSGALHLPGAKWNSQPIVLCFAVLTAQPYLNRTQFLAVAQRRIIWFPLGEPPHGNPFTRQPIPGSTRPSGISKTPTDTACSGGQAASADRTGICSTPGYRKAAPHQVQLSEIFHDDGLPTLTVATWFHRPGPLLRSGPDPEFLNPTP